MPLKPLSTCMTITHIRPGTTAFLGPGCHCWRGPFQSTPMSSFCPLPVPRFPPGSCPRSLLPTDPEAAVTTDHGTRHWAIPCALCPSYELKGSLNRGSLDLSQASLLPFPLGSSGTALIRSIRRSCSNTVSLSPHSHLPKLPWALQGLGIPSSLAGTSFL